MPPGDRDPRLLLDLPSPVFDHVIRKCTTPIGVVTLEQMSSTENVMTTMATNTFALLQTLMGTCKALRRQCNSMLYMSKALMLVVACNKEAELQLAALSGVDDLINKPDRTAVLSLRRLLGASISRSKRALRRNKLQFEKQRHSLDSRVKEEFAKVLRHEEQVLHDAWQRQNRLLCMLQAICVLHL